MNMPLNVAASPVREQAANALRRARALPPGPYRNDLRQLGVGLLKLYKLGLLRANVRVIDRVRQHRLNFVSYAEFEKLRSMVGKHPQDRIAQDLGRPRGSVASKAR